MNSLNYITIIEDDKALNNGIALALRNADYTFRQYYALKEYDPAEKADLIILDINLPDGNGFDFLKKLRQFSDVPVIVRVFRETDMIGICGGKCGTRMKQKILIIEDDDTIQTQLKTLLSGNGYEADAVTDFSRVIEQFKAFAPHLVLLDIKLPKNSGFEICSQIRSFSDIPIVFVTSSNTDMDELYSIMLGGDAFITKPYNTAILLAKIASLLRRAYASGQSETLTWNGAVLHLESSLIEYNGRKADLTKNELKILYYLFKNAGKICPRSDIVDFLWDNQLYVDDNALSVNMTRIREKLASIGLTDFIKTKHRQGYTL